MTLPTCEWLWAVTSREAVQQRLNVKLVGLSLHFFFLHWHFHLFCWSCDRRPLAVGCAYSSFECCP